MPKKEPRTDKKKNVAKVAEVLAENPHATEREIAEKANVSNGTAHNSKKELEQTGAKDETIRYIVGGAKERIKNISKVMDWKTNQVTKKVLDDDGNFIEDATLDNRDLLILKDIAKDDLQRVTVLGGDITDEGGGLRQVLDDIEGDERPSLVS